MISTLSQTSDTDTTDSVGVGFYECEELAHSGSYGSRSRSRSPLDWAAERRELQGQGTPEVKAEVKAESPTKPLKVWSWDRQKKISVTACSLHQAKMKGCENLKLSDDVDKVTMVLEDDGTEVEDEDYFPFMPADTVLMFLAGDKKWTPREDMGIDEPDAASYGEAWDSEMAGLLKGVRHDILRIVSFSEEQLQKIVDCDTALLSRYVGANERFTESLKEGCQRHLDERYRTSEIMNILEQLEKSPQAWSLAGGDRGDSNSRKRRHDDSNGSCN